jgi:NAD(P)-dependent dehydrogenase (short-subunit alcohol dehydrogenase family)
MAIKQKVALVTGGGAGIGYALTQHLLKKGYRVAIIDIDGARATAAQKTLGDDVLGLQCDVSSWESSAAAFKKVFEWAGSIDFFAANAGVAEKESLYSLPDDEEPQKPNLATVEVDLLGVFYGLKLYRHYVRKSGTGRGGKVVITSSMAGNYPMFVAPIYCAAKHGVSDPRLCYTSDIYGVCGVIITDAVIGRWLDTRRRAQVAGAGEYHAELRVPRASRHWNLAWDEEDGAGRADDADELRNRGLRPLPRL